MRVKDTQPAKVGPRFSRSLQRLHSCIPGLSGCSWTEKLRVAQAAWLFGGQGKASWAPLRHALQHASAQIANRCPSLCQAAASNAALKPTARPLFL